MKLPPTKYKTICNKLLRSQYPPLRTKLTAGNRLLRGLLFSLVRITGGVSITDYQDERYGLSAAVSKDSDRNISPPRWLGR